MNNLKSWDDIPKYTSRAPYVCDIGWQYLLDHIATEQKAKLDIDPPFQRAHVWTDSQQRAYVEHVLRGGTVASNDILLNCPHYTHGNSSGPYVLVDGKQRLNAATRFMRDELKVFNGYKRSDFSRPMPFNVRFRWHVNDLANEQLVLLWYLEINEGGTPHTKDELDKVRKMLVESGHKVSPIHDDSHPEDTGH